jgi:hypothetical protein
MWAFGRSIMESKERAETTGIYSLPMAQHTAQTHAGGWEVSNHGNASCPATLERVLIWQNIKSCYDSIFYEVFWHLDAIALFDQPLLALNADMLLPI